MIAEKPVHTNNADRDGYRRRVISFLGEQGFIAIFVLWAVFLTITTDSFATPNNIFTVLRQATIIGILAIGEHLIVLLGTMDISLASILTLTGVAMAAALVHFGLPPLLAALIVLALGALTGLINGLIITRLKINPIITTLGMMSVLEGLAFIYTQGKTIFGEAIEPIKFLSRGRVFDVIPVPVIVLFVLYGLAFFMLRRTLFGAHIFAVGNNERASWLAGNDADNVKLAAFVLACTLAAVGVPITLTALALFLGFLVFCFSNFVPTQNFGLLAALTLVVAFAADVVLLPALMASTMSVTARSFGAARVAAVLGPGAPGRAEIRGAPRGRSPGPDAGPERRRPRAPARSGRVAGLGSHPRGTSRSRRGGSRPTEVR